MIIIIFFSTMFLLMLVAVVLIIISTNKRKGRWGINTNSVVCPKCGETFPKIRKPANLRQALWGGGTCKQCGCEVDKWGNELALK